MNHIYRGKQQSIQKIITIVIKCALQEHHTTIEEYSDLDHIEDNKKDCPVSDKSSYHFQ